MTNTISYYDNHASDFIASTINVDFSEIQNAFTDLLFPGSRILDFGCGSGRDTKYFLEQGYQVEAIDGAVEICRAASEFTGIQVRQLLFQELDEKEKYDGIWACASILHVSKKDLPDVLERMRDALKQNGVIYTSFKYGNFEGERNGRYFTDLTEESFREIIEQIKGLHLEQIWVTGDVREGRKDERWINIILRKRSFLSR